MDIKELLAETILINGILGTYGYSSESDLSHFAPVQD